MYQTNLSLTLAQARELNILDVLKAPIAQSLNLTTSAKALITAQGLDPNKDSIAKLITTFDVQKANLGKGRWKSLELLESQLRAHNLSFNTRPSDDLLLELGMTTPIPRIDSGGLAAQLIAKRHELLAERTRLQKICDEFDAVLEATRKDIHRLQNTAQKLATEFSITDPKLSEPLPSDPEVVEHARTVLNAMDKSLQRLDNDIEAIERSYALLYGYTIPIEANA